MNKKVFLIAIALTASLFFTSCEDDDDETNPKPVIDLTELGFDNSNIAYAGADLHIDADIVAEGNIELATIEIHPKGEHEKGAKMFLDEGEWEFDTTYTKFSGFKNTNFHEHIDIPVHADTGHYHFHFAVSDEDGQQTVVEEELEIQQPDDAIAPEITISSAMGDGDVFENGDAITISGSVSDNKALGGMYIGLVRVDQDLEDAEMNAGNTITLLHTHDFDGPTAHNFSASIDVGAAEDNNPDPTDLLGNLDGGPAWQSANYYILVKCVDAFGGNWTFSDHYPIQINY